LWLNSTRLLYLNPRKVRCESGPSLLYGFAAAGIYKKSKI
jgi:hypothetical protein